jgi:hypothetical protein
MQIRLHTLTYCLLLIRDLRGIFGAKEAEVMGGWRKLYNMELRDLYSSPNIVRIVRSKRMKRTGM